MANRLKMAKVHTIQVLQSRGWSQRRIARELGVHRDTVARHIREGMEAAGPDPPKPAISITGSVEANSPAANPENRPAISITGSADPGRTAPAGQHSRCGPYRDIIIEMLERGLSAQRIWQNLKTEHGFADGYQSVQRFVRKLRSATPLPFRRMECEPGEEAQVDFGTAAPVITSEGKCRRPHLFRIVLSHSRKAYSEAVFRQTTDDFLRCLENAFQHFGGVPKTLVIDNLKAAVSKADWFEPDLNPKVVAFCRHYGTVILPTKVRTPRHKGKVERGVGYAQDNALKGRTFDNLADQNRFLCDWESSVADTRIHGTTRRQVGKIFAEVERAALLPLPLERFPCFREAQRTVNRDGHIEVAKSYYSVPPEFVGRRVWVRWDGHVVRVFDQRLQQVAVHAQREPGRFATDPQHIAPEKCGGIERGATWWLRQAGRIGTETGQWAEDMLAQRGIPGIRVLMGLVSLTNKHADTAVEQACRVARSHGAFSLRDVRSLLKRQAPLQEQFDFIQEHPLIRSLAEYGQLVHNAFQEIHA